MFVEISTKSFWDDFLWPVKPCWNGHSNLRPVKVGWHVHNISVQVCCVWIMHANISTFHIKVLSQMIDFGTNCVWKVVNVVFLNIETIKWRWFHYERTCQSDLYFCLIHVHVCGRLYIEAWVKMPANFHPKRVNNFSL